MKTSADDRVLVDTNVLVYAANAAAPQHAAARALRDRVVAGEIAGCITQQILLEYVSTVTSPKRVPSPVDAPTAWSAAGRIASVFSILPPPADLVPQLIERGRALGIGRAQVFDLAIALTAVSSGVSTVYTYDSTVFSRVAGITVKTPQ